MADKEAFSWAKFLGGIVSPIGYYKTVADLLRIMVIVLILWGGYLLGVKVHSWLAPKKPQAAEFTVVGQQGGEVRNSADQKQTKFGLLNF